MQLKQLRYHTMFSISFESLIMVQPFQKTFYLNKIKQNDIDFRQSTYLLVGAS